MKFDTKLIQFSNIDIKEKRILPKEPSEKLAEFIGILAGDGHVGYHEKSNDYLITISSNAKDELKYLRYAKKLANLLFNFEMKLRKQDNTLSIYKRSKAIFLFLQIIGFQKKNCCVRIPPWILDDDKFAKSFIRGLFDTDGSVSLKNNHGRHKFYPVISIASKDEQLIKRVSIFLKKWDLRFHIGNESYFDNRTRKKYRKTKLEINGYDAAKRWFKLIGTSNNKHKEKLGQVGIPEPLNRLI